MAILRFLCNSLIITKKVEPVKCNKKCTLLASPFYGTERIICNFLDFSRADFSQLYTYDENLEEYIDFERYGEDKIDHETGVFTEKGYLLYHGYNMEMQNILHRNLGLKIKEPQEQTELKLYMPLKAVTYQDENDYGDIETVDFEIEVCSSDLARYEEEIRMAMQKRQCDDGERGMMEYYDHADTINVKVQRYIFDVEEVQGKLMGVAVLTLNASLDAAETAKIKAEISGQASDGYVTKKDMCPSGIEML